MARWGLSLNGVKKLRRGIALCGQLRSLRLGSSFPILPRRSFARSGSGAPGPRRPRPRPSPGSGPGSSPPRRRRLRRALLAGWGGSVPAAGRAVPVRRGRPAPDSEGLRLSPGCEWLRAGGARAGREEAGGGGGVEGKEGARGEREEGASERRREGRPTSSATIIRLKQVQPLPPCEAASRERGKTTWTKLRGKKSGGLGTRHGAADLKKAGGGETAGMPPGLAKPMAPFASPGLSLESGALPR
nr:translation initiation factor IF-2-like [Equus asinus]